mgnify:FL=1|tara:strand:+ start:11230 stop:13440 length:2211 start_codon:yes stop_codon:yes gene_type:complete
MATLTGRAPKDTYGDLMQVSNSNSGVDGTLRFLSDGKGGNSTLKLSSSTAQFTTTLLSTGLLTTTAGITSGSNIISDTDSTDSLGSTSVRWLKLWVDNITMGGAFAGATGTFSSTLAVTGLTTIASLKGTGSVTITDILDEDNMASDSATKLATQQSIKAYVDAQVDTADTLAEVLAIGNTTGGTDVAVSTDDKVQFRDAAIYINSSADGQLDIVADTEIQIAATTVDLNGNLDVSGTALVTGVLTATATSVHTGGITSGGDIISDTDSTDSIGSTGVRWLKGWFDTLAAGTLTIGSGSITDSSGAISFGNENLTTTGIVTAAGTSVFTNLDISGDIDVDGTSNLDIVDIDGAVDMASTLQVDGVATFTGRDIHSGGITIANAGQIGSVGDTDAIAIASDGVVTLTQKLIGTELDISGDIDVDGTTNLDIVDIDGAVNMATTALVTGVLTTTATQVATGGITSGGDIISDADSTDSLGSTGVRWLKGWFDTLQAGTLVMGAGSITDTSGAISFGNEDLTTTGAVAGATIKSSGAVFSGGKTSKSFGTVGCSFEDGDNHMVSDGEACLAVNRLTNDGNLIELAQGGSVEGTIAVSGSTVSYNGFCGTHESLGVSTDTAVGTVVSTIDDLDVYLSGGKSGQTREHHAKIKVSDSVGDVRVYGVIQSFNDDGKSIVASVGIGEVLVTGACSGGDLLVSNGDGTAKVQDDDIIRSKTIGKVTIGDNTASVSSVPCVLYCG